MITRQQLETALEWSYSEPNPKSIEKILELHKNNKQQLLEKMGDWILDFGQVDLEPTQADIEQGFKYFLHDIKSFRWMASSDQEREEIENVINFVVQNKEGFYHNRVMEGHFKGMKITKAIGHILKVNPLLVNELQIQYSKRKPVNNTGNFKMSIHGMDFLTMSENNYDWHSCMALDGEYSAGTLSYMCDACTLIIYLDGSKGELKKLPVCHEPWNDKKWRMMAYVDFERECVYFGGKQYPYSNSMLEDMAVEKLKEVFFPRAEFVDLRLDKKVDFIPQIINEGTHYNDFFFPSERNDAKVLITDKSKGLLVTPLVVGQDVPCLCCGKEHIKISSDWMCHKCGDYYECSCCGEWVHSDDFWGEYDCCSWCMDENYCYCSCCGEYVLDDEYCYDQDCCNGCADFDRED